MGLVFLIGGQGGRSSLGDKIVLAVRVGCSDSRGEDDDETRSSSLAGEFSLLSLLVLVLVQLFVLVLVLALAVWLLSAPNNCLSKADGDEGVGVRLIFFLLGGDLDGVDVTTFDPSCHLEGPCPFVTLLLARGDDVLVRFPLKLSEAINSS